MKLFEGKTKSERNKIIAAIGLGAACLIVLFFAFGRGMFTGSSTSATVKVSPTPKKTPSQASPGKVEMPSKADRDLTESATPIIYEPSRFGTPDAGRNIFAFYEPPPPCRVNCPTPVPPRTPEPPPPSPAAPPPIIVAAINPQSVYAGSKGFRVEISGEKFTPDTRIYFNQQEIPSVFVNEMRMTADVPQPLLINAGRIVLIAQTVDGTKISNPIQFDIQPPPRPNFQYVGMIARKHSNNDTAYFQEQGAQLPTSARLNDVLSGRFRLISISAQETVFEDVNLGFKHKIALFSPPPTVTTSAPSAFPGQQPSRGIPPGTGREVYTPGNPNVPPGGQVPATRGIPGIPDNIPRYTAPPSNTNTRVPQVKQNGDEDDDGID